MAKMTKSFSKFDAVPALVEADLAYLGLELGNIQLHNPFEDIIEDEPLDTARNLLKVMTQRQYIHALCKHVLNVNLLPIQNAILQEIWHRPFPLFVASRGFGKSFLLAVYAFLRTLLKDKTKVVVVGAGFRQSKLILEYMDAIWKNAPVLRDICNRDSGLTKDVDRYTFRVNQSTVIGIPIGNGDKIRGLRANIIIADEFNSIRADVYETVIQGFGSVTASPYENVVKLAKKKFMQKKGLWLDAHEELFQVEGNQSIISGTAGYAFEPFYEYWKRYKTIVESKGNKDILREVFNGDVPDNFNWMDYSVIRVPYEIIPEGFMDDKQVVRARAVIDAGIYQNEYGAVFSKDSTGFFRRSLIESCTTSDLKPIRGMWFEASTMGNYKLKYVIGCDPASERDNFAVVILELHPDHNRIIYAWTVTRKQHMALVEKGITKEHNFYAFCARKLRTLMNNFPAVKIGIDQEGGGRAVVEALHDKDKLLEGEQLIWPVIDPEKEAPTDLKEGLHIVELINFSKVDWVNEANHGLKKDFEDKVTLFPRYDNLSLGLANEIDLQKAKNTKTPSDDEIDLNRLTGVDSLEEIITEIEEIKNELCLIVHTKTDISGRDRWDTPQIKNATGKIGRMRKDRYSALLIANMIARQINRADAPLSFNVGRVPKLEQLPTKKPKTIGSFYQVPYNTFTGIKRR